MVNAGIQRESRMPRTAIVVGHTSGLGEAVARQLLARGDTVLGIARSSLVGVEGSLIEIGCDLEDDAAVDDVVNQIQTRHRTFDLFVFAAGYLAAHELDSLDSGTLQRSFRTNLFAPMLIEGALADLFAENEADIVNITSSSIREYYPKFSEYSASKIALAKFTDDLRRRLQPTAARVIELCPSGFTSRMYERMGGERIERDESLQMRADDVAAFLLSIIDLPKRMEVGQVYLNRK
jgi:NAD(P)-dependent dehydrogenase (short-subunit alcohol dehydrogenase family)